MPEIMLCRILMLMWSFGALLLGSNCQAFTEDSLLTVMEKPLHIMTAVVSVGAPRQLHIAAADEI